MASTEKLQLGTVVSNKMDKTVVVRVDRQKRHRLYRKTIKVTRRYKAHDENNECRLGDIVRIAETRPLSREKRWRVVEVVVRGDVAEIAPTEVGQSQLEEISEAQRAQAEARRQAEMAARAAAAAEAEETGMAEAPAADEAAAAAGEEPDDVSGNEAEEEQA